MPFSLTNAPANFQDMMNHILKGLLNEGVAVHIDDVLIYPKIEEKYNSLLEEVLKRFAENELVLSPEKCIWRSEGVEFLGYVISPVKTEIGEDKIEIIEKWQVPRSLRDV
jgi:hypothetical protein